jgi:hypothetical protein
VHFLIIDCNAIAIARQFFQNKVFFFTSWGSFPNKKREKKVFMKNLPGASNINNRDWLAI